MPNIKVKHNLIFDWNIFFLQNFSTNVCDSGQKWPNLGQCWPKCVIFEFSTKTDTVIFTTPETKKLGNSNAQFSRTMRKRLFFGILSQNWPKEVIFEFLMKKWKRHLLTHFLFNVSDRRRRERQGEFIGQNPPDLVFPWTFYRRWMSAFFFKINF